MDQEQKTKKRHYYAERPYIDKPIDLSYYDKRAKAFDDALTDILAGLIIPSGAAIRLAAYGGMCCGATWSGLMVGSDSNSCPPGWLFVNIKEAEPAIIMACLVAIKIPIIK